MKSENLFWTAFFPIRNEARNVAAYATLLQSGDTILDMGAWEKPYKECFEDRGIRYVSTDIVGNHDYLLDLNTDIIPFKPQTFEGVSMFQSLEHISEPYHALDEAFRVLKTWGYAIISTPFIFALHGIPYDFHRYTEYFYKHVADKYNLEIISISSGIRGFWSVIFLFNHFIDYFSWFLIWKLIVSLPIFIGNILIWLLEKTHAFIPKILKFSLTDRLVTDYVVIYRKK